MTVYDYLRILNGLPEGTALNSENVTILGMVDLNPHVVADDVREESKVTFRVEGNDFITKRTFRLRDGSVTLEKKTPLTDDISLHLGSNESAKKVLEDTIEGLRDLESMEDGMSKASGLPRRDFGARADAMENVLKTMDSGAPKM